MYFSRTWRPVARFSTPVPPRNLLYTARNNPDIYVVAYVNCSAEVKALSDVICTSGNAVQIVNRVPEDREILLVPDQNLGQWVMGQTKPENEFMAGELLRSCSIHL